MLKDGTDAHWPQEFASRQSLVVEIGGGRGMPAAQHQPVPLRSGPL